MRLDGFGLLVEDMAKMIRFYRDVLGFEIREAEDANNVYLGQHRTTPVHQMRRPDFRQIA